MSGSWLWTTCALVGLVSVPLALLYRYQGRLIYMPHYPDGANGLKRYSQTPADFGMQDYEDVFLQTEDGAKIHYWLIRQPNSIKVPTVLMFHGNAGNIEHRLPLAYQFYKDQINVVLVSYRGYGVAEGEPSEEGFNIDSQTVLDHVAQRSDINPRRLIVFGASIGGAVAFALARRNIGRVHAVIVENTFTSLGEIASVVLPASKYVNFMLRERWETRSFISQLETPMLFISGRKDSLVPPFMMDKLFELATNSRFKRFLPIEDGDHNDSWSRRKYWEGIKQFLQDLESKALL